MRHGLKKKHFGPINGMINMIKKGVGHLSPAPFLHALSVNIAVLNAFEPEEQPDCTGR